MPSDPPGDVRAVVVNGLLWWPRSHRTFGQTESYLRMIPAVSQRFDRWNRSRGHETPSLMLWRQAIVLGGPAKFLDTNRGPGLPGPRRNGGASVLFGLAPITATPGLCV